MPARILQWVCCLCLVWLFGQQAAQASEQRSACIFRIENVTAARAEATSTQAPQQGWQPVSLPDNWSRRWPTHDGAVWYRIDWTSDCPLPATPVALTIDAINMAGEVYSNQDLLWRDQNLQEPLSRSWVTSRYWLLPQSSLRAQEANTVWVRVVGVPALRPGLGVVRIGAPEPLYAAQQRHERNISTLFLLNLALSATLSCMALVVWLPQRKEPLLGWYALVSLCWVLLGADVLQRETWPFPSSLTMARATHLAYIAYIASFTVFCWHLVKNPMSSIQLRRLGWLTLAACVVVVLSPGWFVMQRVADLYTLIFLGNTAWISLYALRTRQLQHQLIAAALVVMLSIGARDVLVALNLWDSRDFYSAYTGLLFLLLSALLMRQRLLQDARRIERFNQELSETVQRACDDLNTTLTQEHALALSNAHLQERLQLAQDLHDGLGGQIVRSIMLVEQSEDPPSKERYLSMLKLLRDDLRQVVDSDASVGANAPATPEEWTIPLRYRFVSLFDDLEMRSEWLVPLRWQTTPTPLQCLLLARVAEEALTNTVKHSQAHMVRVSLQCPDAQHLLLRIEDDGIGFDAATAQRSGLGIGMSSMRARMQRLGGSLQVQSRLGCTTIEARLLLDASASAPAVPAQAPVAMRRPAPAAHPSMH